MYVPTYSKNSFDVEGGISGRFKSNAIIVCAAVAGTKNSPDEVPLPYKAT